MFPNAIDLLFGIKSIRDIFDRLIEFNGSINESITDFLARTQRTSAWLTKKELAILIVISQSLSIMIC